MWFGYQGNAGFKEQVGKYSYFFAFLEEFMYNIIFPLIVRKDLPVKPYESEVQMFWITISIFKKHIWLFRLSISFWVSFGSLYLSRNWAISSKLLNFFGLNLFIIFPYCPSNICRICIYVTSLIPDIGLPDMCLFTFFSWPVWLKVDQSY